LWDLLLGVSEGDEGGDDDDGDVEEAAERADNNLFDFRVSIVLLFFPFVATTFSPAVVSWK